MPKILNMQLSNKSAKPVFTIMTPAYKPVKCMLDTGADMPVWCGSEALLKMVFPEIEKVDKKFLLGGFGRKPEMVAVYKIPEFTIRNQETGVSFRNLYVASSFGRNFGCDLILSATMFSHMDYSILNRKAGASVLQILFDRDTYYTFLVSNGTHLGIAERISSFASEASDIQG